MRVSTRPTPTFSQREKLAAKQPDEGLRRPQQSLQRRSPSPVAFGDTLSLWEKVDCRIAEILQ